MLRTSKSGTNQNKHQIAYARPDGEPEPNAEVADDDEEELRVECEIQR